jgi:NhaC family Na+:H+ antiporter
MIETIKVSMQAVLILLTVGSLIGSWIISGTVPSMIYYGVQIMSPDYFYITSCIVCAMLGLSIGSSWTVAGTLGIGLIGIATVLDVSLAITAGAIISGAYFGDKLSPLSETTNLAAAVTRTDLFNHIQHMLWTTVPAILISLSIFLFLGLTNNSNIVISDILILQDQLNNNFKISPVMLIPLLALFYMARKKVPALLTLLIGTFLGCLFAITFQMEMIFEKQETTDLNAVALTFRELMNALFIGFESSTGNQAYDDLISKGGMVNMMSVVGLVITAMAFGGAMSKAGLLERLIRAPLSKVKSTGGLIATTVGTCIGTNAVASDQYLSIVLPGQMLIEPYKERKLKAVNLSRTLEDSGTLTSALFPWNTCGAYMAGTLGISTLTYAPFAFFNYLCPVIAIIYGVVKFAVPTDEKKSQSLEAQS